MTTLVLASLTGSLISIAVVQLCIPWLRPRLGARIAYACWLLPWIGMIASILPRQTTAGIVPERVVASMLSLPVVAFAGRLAEAPAGQIATFAWAAMAVLFFTSHLLVYRAFILGASRQAIELGRAGAVRIFSGPNISTPVAAGVFSPRIFLPADFGTSFSLDEQRMILRHEQAHHDRHDITANLAGLLMMSLHWWNPLAYRAHRRFRADQELACDATAITSLGYSDRQAYATAILKCASRSHVGIAAPMSGRTDTAARLLAVASRCPQTYKSTRFSIFIVALLGSFIAGEAVVTDSLLSSPLLLAAASQSSTASTLTPDQSIMHRDASGVEPSDDGWRPTTVSPLLATYNSRSPPEMRLILIGRRVRQPRLIPPSLA